MKRESYYNIGKQQGQPLTFEFSSGEMGASFTFSLFSDGNSQSSLFTLPLTQGDTRSMKSIKKKRCRNCKKLFQPYPHNATRQEYCRAPECRKASKADSQKRWMEKPENLKYFCGPINVQRVQEWRKKNPGYWRRKSEKTISALQETLNQQPAENTMDTADLPSGVSQDILNSQHIVLLGLIANFTGSALQDNISGTPFIVVYWVKGAAVQILRLLHHSRKWP